LLLASGIKETNMDCVNCGRDISPRASTCPHCGEPDPGTDKYCPSQSEREASERADKEGNSAEKFQWTLTGVIVVGVAIWALITGVGAGSRDGPVAKVFIAFFIGIIGGGFWGGGAAWLLTAFLMVCGVFKKR
jgi:hypothetical protein